MRITLVLLALAAIVLVAGCTGGGIPTDTGTETTTDELLTPTHGTTGAYHGCPSEPENYTKRAVPEPPGTLTEWRVREYVESHATATMWNSLVDSHRSNEGIYELSGSVAFGTTLLNDTGTGYYIEVTGGGYRACSPDPDGGYEVSVADATPYTYFVNESVVIREGGFLRNASAVIQEGNVVTRLNETGT